jgi:molybdopterin synthase sulfur carrier subunit
MKIKLVAFGISKDILGTSESEFVFHNGSDIKALKNALINEYPEFDKLKSISFAVDEEYQSDEYVLSENQEIVIIPPVSGG